MSWGRCGGSNLTKVTLGLSLDVTFQYRQAEITSLREVVQHLFVVCAGVHVCMC